MNAKSATTIFSIKDRGAGILLHVTSLPGPYGIGDVGPAARRWIDMLVQARQRWWQMLPLGPCGEGNSPYKCYSAFAGNPLLISPDDLVSDGLLKTSDLPRKPIPGQRADFAQAARLKEELLRIAYERFAITKSKLTKEFARFISSQSHWLEDFALFMALLRENSSSSWVDWPTPLRRRNPKTLREAKHRLSAEISFHQFAQFIFFRQLQFLRKHAATAGVGLIGDMPIFVSPESADVWTHPELFQLDRHLRPRAVAGVPPDQFSSDGQLWGNPLYNWKQMATDHFVWWKARLKSALAQADVVRIDHFRGFEAYWSIPYGSPTAQTGKWVRAPGTALFRALLESDSSMQLLAEDLGVITPEVELLRDTFHLPGMRVLQFGFSAEPGNPHTPHNFIPHCFAYTGTHDNSTTHSWYNSLSPPARRLVMRYAPASPWKTDPVWSLIQLLQASCAANVIVPLQDILCLGDEARMNTPGQPDGNWAWRLDSFRSCRKPLARLAEMTETYERERSKTV